MAVRHRVSFRGDQRPWSVEHARPGPHDVVDLDPGHRDGPPRPLGPVAVSQPRRRRGRIGVLAVLVVVAIGVATTLGDNGGPAAEPEAPAPVTSPDFAAPRPAGPVWIPAEQVVRPPMRASLNRYWPTDAERAVRRTHVWLLDDLGARADGVERRGLLVADPTRRAQVPNGTGDLGPPAVRRLAHASGLVTWEWDRPGWGFSLLAYGLGDDAAAALVDDAVRVPDGPSLEPAGPPDLDGAVLEEVGLHVRWTRWQPAAVVGGPLVGQGGSDTIEGYAYAPGPDAAAGPILVSVVRDRTVRASDLVAVGAPTVTVAGRSAAVLEAPVVAPVGFRITGGTRLVFDVGDLTMELASDGVDASGLVALAASFDFERLGWFLRTG